MDMNMSTEDYLKKALLDTQERIRDFMSYSERIENDELKAYFKDYAQEEGMRARELQIYLQGWEGKKD